MVDQPSQSTSPTQLDLLFTAGERLGWTFRDRDRLRRPYPKPPPQPRPVSNVAMWALERIDNYLGRWLFLAVFIGAVLFSCWSEFRDYGTLTQAMGRRWGWAELLTLMFAPALLLYLLVRFWGTPQHLRWRDRRATARWRRRAARFDRAEAKRVGHLPQWGVVPAPGGFRLDVIGGNAHGWQGLLAVYGASALATHGALTVVDLSRDAVTGPLIDLATGRGLPVTVQVLPRDLADSDLLLGLDRHHLVDLLVESIHADTEDPHRAQRFIDQRILSAVCTALGDDVTLARLAAAMRLLTGHLGPTPELTPTERTTIIDELFTAEFRQQAFTNLQRLDAHLDPVRGLGSRNPPPPTGNLNVVVVDDDANAAGELLHDLILQRLIRRIGEPADPIPALVIAGADRLAARHLDRLSQECATHGVRLLLMFHRLHNTALEVLGRGAVGFMTLRHHEDATAAADFIGREHTFILTQQTTTDGGSESKSDSRTVGESGPQFSGGPFGGPLSDGGSQWSTSRTASTGSSVEWSDSTTTQRVYEYAAEPTLLQGLPDHHLLLVEPNLTGPRMLILTCDPHTLTLPGVDLQPLPDDPWIQPSTHTITER